MLIIPSPTWGLVVPDQDLYLNPTPKEEVRLRRGIGALATVSGCGHQGTPQPPACLLPAEGTELGAKGGLRTLTLWHKSRSAQELNGFSFWSQPGLQTRRLAFDCDLLTVQPWGPRADSHKSLGSGLDIGPKTFSDQWLERWPVRVRVGGNQLPGFSPSPSPASTLSGKDF